MKTTPLIVTVAVLATAHISSADTLGPANPTFDGNANDWFSGSSGEAWVEYNATEGAIANTGRMDIGSNSANDNADFRSQTFSLGAAADGAAAMTFGFQYLFYEEVQAGDNFRVDLRFWRDIGGTDFAGEQNLFIGHDSGDVSLFGPDAWQSFSETDIFAPGDAGWADIRVSINDFTDWSSGGASFDDFSVIPEPGTYAAIVGFLALGTVILRRKMIRRG